jgi:hypothetical protein
VIISVGDAELSGQTERSTRRERLGATKELLATCEWQLALTSGMQREQRLREVHASAGGHDGWDEGGALGRFQSSGGVGWPSACSTSAIHWR